MEVRRTRSPGLRALRAVCWVGVGVGGEKVGIVYMCVGGVEGGKEGGRKGRREERDGGKEERKEGGRRKEGAVMCGDFIEWQAASDIP